MGTVPPPKPTDEHRAEAEAPEGDPSEAPVAQRAPGREPRKSARPPAEAPPVSAKSDEIENPPWTQAGIVACVGFVIGVLWPRIFGVHLSQTAPGLENPTPSADPSAVTAVAPLAPISATAAAAASGAPSAAPAPEGDVPTAGGTTVVVGKAAVLSCRTKSGDAKKDGCGSVDPFADAAATRLKRLATCPAAQGANGKLSIVATVDFAGKRVDVAAGRSSTVPSPDRYLTCVNQAFQGIDLSETHDFPRYVLAYAVNFTAAPAAAAEEPAAAKPEKGGDAVPENPGATPAAASPEVATSGTGEVVWNSGTVRSTPTTGEIVARLKKGAKVTIIGSKDGSYHVKYDGGEGWISREAIGK